jgi:cell filamentation protein
MAEDDPQLADPHFDYKNNILRNVPGFTRPDQLDRFERKRTARAILNLQTNPVRGCFDIDHLKEIHTRIFKDIYPWAGEFRQVNIRRSGSYYFGMVQFIEPNLASTLTKLAAEDHLKGLDADAFASRAAFFLGELNSIHPFREGNGRTQREFIRQLAVEAGYHVNWGRVTREQMYDASIESHNLGNNAAFAELVALAMEPGRFT